VRRYVGDQSYKVETIAIADDVEDTNEVEVLDFWQAQASARNMRPSSAPNIKDYTVADAVRDYLTYLETKSSHRISRQRAEAYILPELGRTAVNDLDEDDLRRWHRKIADQPARVRTRPGAPQQYKQVNGDLEARRKRELSANIILNLLRAALRWWEGEYLPYENDPSSQIMIFAGTYRRALDGQLRSLCMGVLSRTPSVDHRNNSRDCRGYRRRAGDPIRGLCPGFRIGRRRRTA